MVVRRCQRNLLDAVEVTKLGGKADATEPQILGIEWNGLDDYGRSVPDGAYRVRGCSHPGLKCIYEYSFLNPGSPPWEHYKNSGWGAITDILTRSPACEATTRARGESHLAGTRRKGARRDLFSARTIRRKCSRRMASCSAGSEQRELKERDWNSIPQRCIPSKRPPSMTTARCGSPKGRIKIDLRDSAWFGASLFGIATANS